MGLPSAHDVLDTRFIANAGQQRHDIKLCLVIRQNTSLQTLHQFSVNLLKRMLIGFNQQQPLGARLQYG